MNNNTVIRNKLIVTGVILGVVLLATITSAVLGYHLGLQTPAGKLGPEVGVEESARIAAIIYGVIACLIGMAILITYLLISFLFESWNKIKRVSK